MSDPLWHTSDMRRQVFWWVSVVTLVLVAIPVAARIAEQEAGPLAIVVAFMPWVMFACVVPLVFGVLARDSWIALMAVALLAISMWWQAPLFSADSGGEPALRVASINATMGKVDAASVVSMVQAHQVDILAVQELTPEAVAAFAAAGLDQELPQSMKLPADGFAGIGVWSRYPMTAEALRGFVGHAIEAQVATEAGDFTVVAAHPAAPGLFDHTLWSQDLARLRGVLDAAVGPTLVLGDFNATRDHAEFREFERLGYDDAADQAGSGFSFTFPEGRAPWPLVEIDHAMVRDTDLTALLMTTQSIPGADHRAIFVVYGPRSD